MKLNKTILATVAITALVLAPASVMAAKYLPWTENIYSISRPEANDCGFECRQPTVSTFYDMGNRCYVVTSVDHQRQAISCVKAK